MSVLPDDQTDGNGDDKETSKGLVYYSLAYSLKPASDLITDLELVMYAGCLSHEPSLMA